MKRLFRYGICIVLAVLLLLSAGPVSYADEAIFGDADGDGELTAQDAECISQHLRRIRMMDEAAATRADLDGDGKITDLDLSMLMNLITSPELKIRTSKTFSMLLTSDLCGNAWDPTASETQSSCTAMNTAACIRARKEQDPNLLLLDAGGSLFGSFLSDQYSSYTYRSCGPITSLFLMCGYDAVLLGDEAFTYGSQTVRREVNELQNRKTPVLGANLLINNPTVFDPEDARWNEVVPYVLLETNRETDGTEREPMQIAVIGVTQPDLAPSADEVLPVDPLTIVNRILDEIGTQSDYTVLLYHGNVEADAGNPDSYSLRDLIKNTDGIDLVVASHGAGGSVRSERNARGVEVPIVSLAGGAETVTEISVSLRAYGPPAILVDVIDASAYEPDDSIRLAVQPYVSKVSGMMDAVVCSVMQRTDRFDPDALCATDAMEILHEMQLYAVDQWQNGHDVDLPNNMISIAYPYIPIGGWKEGPLTYRDLCTIEAETPSYTLMLIRGSELRAWLGSYAGVLMEQDTIYSLYGLSYLLNTMNKDVPVGFLEHANGMPVEDEELFTLILAEKNAGDLNLNAFIDESWMPYEERVIEGFSLPSPYALKTLPGKPVINALAAYLEHVGTLTFKHLYTWIVI